jgi:hypothetical protein
MSPIVQSFIFTVGSDPDPHDAVFDLSTESSVMCANPDGSQLAEPLEVKGRVSDCS